MKLNKSKKGFTIVELVIVIGVIGILSAILIPTFVNLSEKAKEAAVKEECASAYASYVSEAADGKVGTYDIQFLAQDEVALKYKEATEETGTWFCYDSDNGWHKYTPASDPTTYVCAEHEAESTYNTNYVFYVK